MGYFAIPSSPFKLSSSDHSWVEIAAWVLRHSDSGNLINGNALQTRFAAVYGGRMPPHCAVHNCPKSARKCQATKSRSSSAACPELPCLHCYEIIWQEISWQNSRGLYTLLADNKR